MYEVAINLDADVDVIFVGELLFAIKILPQTIVIDETSSFFFVPSDNRFGYLAGLTKDIILVRSLDTLTPGVYTFQIQIQDLASSATEMLVRDVEVRINHTSE